MSGYNTECTPHTTVVPAEATRSELHLQLTVVFACGRTVAYGYSHRFKSAENRKPCRRCARAAEIVPTLSWKQVEERFAEAYAKLPVGAEQESTPNKPGT